mgnify:CR=1 FL=1
MSDKFFFKGRQDARQDHTNHGFQTKATQKAGSKKYPLALIVTSEKRKQEVSALADAANIYTDIHVDSSEGAIESVAELTAQLNKSSTVKVEKKPARNEPCTCGSGKKYKKCCA